MKKFILDLLFPISCLECNQEGKFICSACFEKIPLIKNQPVKNLIITSHYNHPLIKKAVHRYKYDFVKKLAKPLGHLMVKKLNQQNIKNPILIPIPLHLKRLRWRGFNQADLLARQISKELNIPIINNLLIQTKHTLPQMKIKNAKKRKQNIKHAFALNSRNVLKNDVLGTRTSFSGRSFILIDDISTTGATLKECAKVLKPLKPKKIYGLVIAKG